MTLAILPVPARPLRLVIVGCLTLHRSRRPRREVDLSTLADHGQGDLFHQKCSGLFRP